MGWRRPEPAYQALCAKLAPDGWGRIFAGLLRDSAQLTARSFPRAFEEAQGAVADKSDHHTRAPSDAPVPLTARVCVWYSDGRRQ